MNCALKIFSTTNLLYLVDKQQLRFKKDEKQTRLRSGKNTIGIYDALCSDRRIEDTGSHRLKITERDRKTSSRKTEPTTALCSSGVQQNTRFSTVIREVFTTFAISRLKGERVKYSKREKT